MKSKTKLDKQAEQLFHEISVGTKFTVADAMFTKDNMYVALFVHDDDVETFHAIKAGEKSESVVLGMAVIELSPDEIDFSKVEEYRQTIIDVRPKTQ